MHIFVTCCRLSTEISEAKLTLKKAGDLCMNQVQKVMSAIGFGTKLHHLASDVLELVLL